MTLGDIRGEVCALGFESEIRNGEDFIFALNRALSQIYTVIDIHSTLTFFQSAPEKRISIGKIFHTGGSVRTVNLPKGAYTFFLSGSGHYSLKDSFGVREFSFDTKRERCSGFVTEDTELSFYGDFFFSVYDLTLYPGYITGDVSEIPIGRGYSEYSIEEYAPDYLAIKDMPTDEKGNEIEGAEICCGKIRIPSSYCGEVNLTYRRSAPKITLDDHTSELDIPREAEHLVPLLTAAYVWLDDDADKAQYYMALYRENLASLKLYTRSCQRTDTAYTDLTGWAG